MRAALVAVLVAFAPVAFAQDPAAPPTAGTPTPAADPPSTAPEPAMPEAPKAAEPAEPEHHGEAKGEHHAAHHGDEPLIVNWWSWDYGPNAKDPEHKGWPPPFGFALVNFAIFLFIMQRLLFKPLARMARERHDRIKTALDEATALRKAAEDKLTEYTKRVANVDEEVKQLLAQIQKEAELDKARLIAAAEAEGVRIKAEAEKQIAAELQRMKVEIRREVVAAVVASAEAIVTKNITADDQKKLADRYIADVANSGGAGS
jgi:F-type H+-transporting ATPase subunit b